MLEVGKLRVPPNYSSHLNWVTANAESLPFEDNSFDIYTIAFGIRNCTHPEKVLNEAFRVLKPKGFFKFLFKKRILIFKECSLVWNLEKSTILLFRIFMVIFFKFFLKIIEIGVN